jgi:hypothetical protein
LTPRFASDDDNGYLVGKMQQGKAGLGKKHRHKDKSSRVILRVTVADSIFGISLTHFSENETAGFSWKTARESDSLIP